jgi:hypothetical protein
MSNVGEIQSVLFKQVPGGYVFQQPNPWVFGRSSRYLVNEAQKAALLAIVTPRRPILKGAVILAGVLLWAVAASTLVWAFSSHDEPTTRDVIAMLVLIVGPMLAALIVALQCNLRRMRSVLAGAPRTDERITRGELRRAMADAMSMKRALLIGGTWTFTCVMQTFGLVVRNARHPLFSDALSFINLFVAIVAAGLAVHYLLIALRKARQQALAS